MFPYVDDKFDFFAQALRPLFGIAIEAGEAPADLDVDAMVSVFVLLLPHLAPAPFDPGVDAGLACCGTVGARRSKRARRMLATVLAPAVLAS